jgi:hypothetical protein
MEMSLAKALAQNELANQLDDNILHQLSRPIVSVASYASGLFSSTKKLAPPTSSFASKSRKRNSVRTSSRMDGKRRSAEHRRIAGGRTHLYACPSHHEERCLGWLARPLAKRCPPLLPPATVMQLH